MKYKLRIPALSQFWKFVDADSADEAFDKVVSELERDAPQIRWRDKSVWEIWEVDDPLVGFTCPTCGSHTYYYLDGRRHCYACEPLDKWGH